MDTKIKHLDFIQTVIGRMAHNSFLLKGWTITVAGALLFTTFREININYLYVSATIVVLFWFLDAHFLYKERLFRKLYDSVRNKNESDIDFSMDIKDQGCCCEWFRSTFSSTLIIFYGGILLIHLLVLNLI